MDFLNKDRPTLESPSSSKSQENNPWGYRKESYEAGKILRHVCLAMFSKEEQEGTHHQNLAELCKAATADSCYICRALVAEYEK
jgi:hypothetical protein